MDYGYGQMGKHLFVSAGFVVVMAAFFALCVLYAVGASSGKRTAHLFLRGTMLSFAVVMTAVALYAVASGELKSFVAAYGTSSLMEMVVLAALCIGSMWFMGDRYVRDKRENTEVDAPARRSSV